MNSSSKFRKITSKEELLKVINFISKGLNLSSIYSANVFNSLIEQNDDLGYFGFVMLDKHKSVAGAILAISQGFIALNGKKIRLINTSSWYIKPNHRGYKSILMANDLPFSVVKGNRQERLEISKNIVNKLNS